MKSNVRRSMNENKLVSQAQKEAFIAHIQRLYDDSGKFYFVSIILLLFSAIASMFFAYNKVISLILPYIFIGFAILAFSAINKTWCFYGVKHINLKDFLCVLISAVPIYLFVTIFSSFVSNILVGSVDDDPALTAFCSEHSFGVLFLVLALLPAVVEEFEYRSLIFGLLKLKSVTFAIILSAISFSLIHMEISSLLPTFVFGIILGFIREITGSVWGTIFIHTIFNTTTLFLTKYPDIALNNALLSANGVMYAIILAVSLIIIIVCIACMTIGHELHFDYVNKRYINTMPWGYIAGWILCILVTIVIFLLL